MIAGKKLRGYRGCKAILTSMHDKQRAIAPALHRRPGISVETARGIDTDVLGTFTGEIQRPCTPSDAAIRKALLGMESTGIQLGIGSEGSFGPDPDLHLVPGGFEVMAFIDAELGIEVIETRRSRKTNFGSREFEQDGPSVDAFLDSIGFPSHAVIVRPGGSEGTPVEADRIDKGIVDREVLGAAIARCREGSETGSVRIEADMRAHMNPTRMAEIGTLARALGDRLATHCPECGAPGFGRIDARPGLPCSACDRPTRWIVTEVWGCRACHFVEERPRSDGLPSADPGNCRSCNP